MTAGEYNCDERIFMYLYYTIMEIDLEIDLHTASIYYKMVQLIVHEMEFEPILHFLRP